MSKPTRPDDDEPMTATEVCGFLGISSVTLWRMVNQSRLPKPYYARSRSPRWVRGEIRTVRDQMPRMTPSEAKAAHRAGKLKADALRQQEPASEDRHV
jgi:predicted DNA-binding transcriptional regulator AlpA